MKILIAADMEGITGVVNWDQVTPGHAEYARFRRIMTGDVNAAVRGAFEAGADEIIVADGHWNGSNILIEELDSRARLCNGSPSPLSMMEGVDTGVDGVCFIGYHARAGSQNAILDHTWSDVRVANVWLNNVLVGEYGLNAAVAGYYGVPIVMVSGDQTACAQTVELLGPLETAVVKQARSRFAAECLTPPEAQEQISQSARRAVERLAEGDSPEPYIVDAPVSVTIEFRQSDMADRASRLPGSQRAGLRIAFSSPDMVTAYLSFRAAVSLAAV
jgi:D-amino peptidase